MHPGWIGLLVWVVHDLPVTECCPVWPTAETDGVCPCLLQLYGADNSPPKRMPWQPLQARRVGKDVQGLLLCRAPTWESPHGGTPERPAPYHPFGPTQGALGAGREWYPDAYSIPTIYIHPVEPATEAGGVLSLTATHWEEEWGLHCLPCTIGCRPSWGGTWDRAPADGRYNGCPWIMVQWWISHRPPSGLWDQRAPTWPLLQLSERGSPLASMQGTPFPRASGGVGSAG